MSRGKKNKDRAAVWTCSVQSCQSTGFFLGGGKRGGLELVVLLALIVKGTALGAALVQLGDDWGGNVLDLLLGRLEVVSVGIVVLREPLDLLLNSLLDGGLVVVAELVLEAVEVRLELVAGLDALLEQAVLLGVLLCLVDHALNVLWGEAVLVVGDGDGFLGARALVLCRDAEDAVDVNLKGDFNLGHAAWRGRDVVEVKLAQEVVVFVMGRSPSKTWMVTVGWLSAAVEKIWDFFVGTTELRSMSLVMTPPTVSIPRVRGLTSRS